MAGIGLGIAKGLAEVGASVAIAGRNAVKAETALHELGPRSVFIDAEIATPDSCKAMVAWTVEKFGRLDILVNNAGITIIKQPELFTPARSLPRKPPIPG